MSLTDTIMVQDGAVPDDTVAAESLPTLELVGPLAGFPDQRHFALVELDASGLLCSLQSLEEPDLRFLVLPPAPFFPSYEPEISDDWAEALELTSADEALVLLIINTGASAAEATANLLAPIVINLRTRRAAQVVLEDASLPVRAPLHAAQ